MAKNTIGSETFDVWQGDIQVPGQVVQRLDRLGRNYTRTRTAGKFSRESIIRTVNYEDSIVIAEPKMEITFPDMKGTVVSVTNSLNETFTNCTILDYALLSYQAVIRNGATKYRIVSEWTILAGELT